jgi:hypothetical protein
MILRLFMKFASNKGPIAENVIIQANYEYKVNDDNNEHEQSKGATFGYSLPLF